jgi:hypothetical protein
MIPDLLKKELKFGRWFLGQKTGRPTKIFGDINWNVHKGSRTWVDDVFCSPWDAVKNIPRTPMKGIGTWVRPRKMVLDFDSMERYEAVMTQIPLSYTELSPSGRGVHVWYAVEDDDLPSWPNLDKTGFEVYTRSKAMTVTCDTYMDWPVTMLTRQQAMDILQLAGWKPEKAKPRASSTSSPVLTSIDDQDGWWGDNILSACLDAWKNMGRGFDFCRGHQAGTYWVSCPGNVWQWLDSLKHSCKGEVLSNKSMVFLRDGWPCFVCFSQACNGDPKKSWKDLANFWDPTHQWDAEKWLEEQISVGYTPGIKI